MRASTLHPIPSVYLSYMRLDNLIGKAKYRLASLVTQIADSEGQKMILFSPVSPPPQYRHPQSTDFYGTHFSTPGFFLEWHPPSPIPPFNSLNRHPLCARQRHQSKYQGHREGNELWFFLILLRDRIRDPWSSQRFRIAHSPATSMTNLHVCWSWYLPEVEFI